MDSPEYDRLREIETLVMDMFKAAARDGLYVGMGKSGSLPDTMEAQEGRIVKRLRTLVGKDVLPKEKN